jgi:two-component system, probable response regulator PhcQ
MIMKRPQVLLVDDEPEVISAIKEALFHEPYEIVGIGDPLEALRVLASKPFDVVVADEKMPNMGGAEFLGTVRRDFPATIRIILTGHATVSSAVQAINEGAVYRYLLKPFPASALGEIIRQGLGDRQATELRDRIVDGAVRQHDALIDYAAAFPASALGEKIATPQASSVREVRASTASAALSQREKQIVSALAAGKDPKTIAQTLEISVHTVRSHLKTIYRKVGVRTQLELVTRVLGENR